MQKAISMLKYCEQVHLQAEDWRKLTMAMGSLSNAGIFIDDTPGIRVNEIRSKCRRLKTRTWTWNDHD